MIVYIVTYVFLLTNLITTILAYNILTKEKIKISIKKTFCIVLLTLFSLIIRYLNNELLTLITNIIFIFITLKIFFGLNFNKNIYYSTILIFISLFSDALISILISNSYLLNMDLFQKKYYMRALLNIPVCIMIMLFCSIPFIKMIISNFYEKYMLKIKLNKTKILFIYAVILIIGIAFCFNAYNESDRIGHLFVIFGISSFTLLFAIILYLMYKEYQIKLLNKNIMEENKYIKDVAKQEEEFKHNLVNNLLGIKTVGNKKVNKLIDELILEYKTDYKNITNINDLPEGILSIIYRKAYDENIDNLNLAVDNLLKNELIDILSPKNYNQLCTSIGILFDNALDAIKSCKEKIIEITLLEDDDFIYYVQKNSFNNIIDLEKIGTKDFTTKKNGHGIGLNYINKLKNIEIKNTIVNNMFTTKLKIKKIKM